MLYVRSAMLAASVVGCCEPACNRGSVPDSALLVLHPSDPTVDANLFCGCSDDPAHELVWCERVSETACAGGSTTEFPVSLEVELDIEGEFVITPADAVLLGAICYPPAADTGTGSDSG